MTSSGVTLICPTCRRPPASWPLAATTGTCTNPACAATHPMLDGSDIRLVVRSSPHVFLEFDDGVRFEHHDEVQTWLSSLEPGSDPWERALRLGMYTELHHEGKPYAQTSLFDRFIAPVGAGVRTAVDLGCGVGGLTTELSARLDCDVVGLDSWGLALRLADAATKHPNLWVPKLSEDMSLRCEAVAASSRRSLRPIRWVCADVHHPPLPASAFDLVTAVNLFDTVTDPALALGQASALLRPGGLLLIAQPDAWTATATPADRWLPSSGTTWESLLEHYELETVDEQDGFEWTLSRSPRVSYTYVSSARLLTRRSTPA